MRLYNSAVSGNCYKVRWLLSLLGHEFETVELSVVDRSDREQKLGGKTPFLRVPVLELDDGSCLPESNAILCWLAEGSEYLPSDRTARARVMQWLFFEQNLHEPNIAVVRFWVAYAKSADEYPQPVEIRTAAGNAVLETMDRHLAENRWFAGENFTIADIALYAYTHVAGEGGFDLRPLAKLRRWLADVAARAGHITIDG